MTGWAIKHIKSPEQDNITDCGIHTIMNALCVTLNTDPIVYRFCRMKGIRLFFAAVLLNGGFKDYFGIRHGGLSPYPYDMGGNTFWQSLVNVPSFDT